MRANCNRKSRQHTNLHNKLANRDWNNNFGLFFPIKNRRFNIAFIVEEDVWECKIKSFWGSEKIYLNNVNVFFYVSQIFTFFP